MAREIKTYDLEPTGDYSCILMDCQAQILDLNVHGGDNEITVLCNSENPETTRTFKVFTKGQKVDSEFKFLEVLSVDEDGAYYFLFEDLS